MATNADIVNYCNGGFFTGPTGSAGVTGTYYGVTAWAGPRGWSPGSLVRQSAVPALNAERIFVALTGGTGVTGTEPTWATGRGAQTSELNGSTMIWQECTGLAALNGDLSNTPTWAQLKSTGTSPLLGTVIKSNDGSSVQICSTAGLLGVSQPSFSTTAGVRTVDNGAVWVSLGNGSLFSAWGAPHARLQNAVTTNWTPGGWQIGTTGTVNTAVGNNGTCFIGNNHNEGQAQAMTLSTTVGNASSSASILKIVSVNKTAAPPSALSAGAVVGQTGSVALSFTFSDGGIYFYGVTLSAGSGFSNSLTDAYNVFDTCVLAIPSSSANTIRISAGNSGIVVFDNTQVYFGNTGSYIDPGTTNFTWRNTATPLVSGSLVPRALIGAATAGRFNVISMEGVDLSALTGPSVINNQPLTEQHGLWLVKDCKLAAAQGTTGFTGPAQFGQVVQYVNSDSSATAYKSTRAVYEGTESTETTIVRSGGATDLGNQAQSRKIVTTATSTWLRPFKAEPMTIYNNKTGQNVTVSVYGTWNVASVPNNDDIWIEVEYLGTAGAPLGVFANDTTSNIFAANAAQTADGVSSWGGGGSGAGWSPFVLSVTLNGGTYPQPQLAGNIQVRVRAAKISSTFYIDPKIVLT